MAWFDSGCGDQYSGFFFFFFFLGGGGVGVICTAFKKSLLRAWFDTSYGDNIQMVKKKKKLG